MSLTPHTPTSSKSSFVAEPHLIGASDVICSYDAGLALVIYSSPRTWPFFAGGLSMSVVSACMMPVQHWMAWTRAAVLPGLGLEAGPWLNLPVLSPPPTVMRPPLQEAQPSLRPQP